jgi:hypothetical protein
MKVEKLWWSCLSLLVFACPPPRPPEPMPGTCANETCTAEQRCDLETLHCVSDDPPVLTVVAPTDVITQATFVVTGKVVDDGKAATVDWKLGDSGSFAAITTAADGTFSVTINTPAALEGTVALVVRASDARTEVTVEKTLTVDVVAPTIDVVSPVANGLQTTSAIDASVTTSAGTVSVTISRLGTQVPMQGGPTSWTISQLPIATRDGEDDVLRFIARDAAGNLTTVDHPIRIDNVAPRVTITSPAADAVLRDLIFVSARTDTDAASVTITAGGNTVPMTGGPLDWNVNVTNIQQDFAPVMLRVTAQDAVGNSSFSDVTIYVDTVAPVITFTMPSADQKFNAADLSSNSSVTTAWTVADADTQAHTHLVNGALSMATSITVATSATDNPTQYTTTVSAQDRAGNIGHATRSYSVDRVIPTITSYTPAANTRMMDGPATVSVSFSEPVFGPFLSSEAIRTSTGLPPGAWTGPHDGFSINLGSSANWRGKVAQVHMDPLADAYGNPVATPAPRLFHVATVIPSGTLLASNVRTFAAASDGDGQLRVNYLTTAGAWGWIADDQGVLNNGQPFAITGTRVAVNTWSTVNPSTLTVTSPWGASIYDAAAPVNARYRHIYNSGTAQYPQTVMGAVVSAPPLNREGATDTFGFVMGNTYTRGTFTRTFTTNADMVTAVSADSWATASYSGSQVRWSRYRCNRDTQLFPGPATYSCEGTEYGGSFGSLVVDALEAVMTRSGNCLIVNAAAPQGTGRYHGGWAQRLENCDGALAMNPPASCTSNTTLPLTAGALFGQKVAPFSANGEDTILFAFPANDGDPTHYRLEKMVPGQCSFFTTQTAPFSVSNVREFQPVQIGNKPAFIYVNTSNELRVFVP